MPNPILIAVMVFYLATASITAQASLKLPQTIKVDRAALTAEPPCDPKIFRMA